MLRASVARRERGCRHRILTRQNRDIKEEYRVNFISRAQFRSRSSCALPGYTGRPVWTPQVSFGGGEPIHPELMLDGQIYLGFRPYSIERIETLQQHPQIAAFP